MRKYLLPLIALLLPGIAHEPTSKTGLSHTDGAISMARGAPGTAAVPWAQACD
jgi:hypothetical protein